jgi:hypothetical protein
MLWFSDSWVRWPKFLQRFNSLIPKIAKLKYLCRQRKLMQQIQNICVQRIESDVHERKQ